MTSRGKYFPWAVMIFTIFSSGTKLVINHGKKNKSCKLCKTNVLNFKKIWESESKESFPFIKFGRNSLWTEGFTYCFFFCIQLEKWEKRERRERYYGEEPELQPITFLICRISGLKYITLDIRSKPDIFLFTRFEPDKWRGKVYDTMARGQGFNS